MLETEAYVCIHITNRERLYVLAEFFEERGDKLLASNGVTIEQINNAQPTISWFDEAEFAKNHYHISKIKHD